jgi:hypothetical protein
VYVLVGSISHNESSVHGQESFKTHNFACCVGCEAWCLPLWDEQRLGVSQTSAEEDLGDKK